MTRADQPTAYWVIRDSDDEPFTLVADRDTAAAKAEYYTTDHCEQFRITREFRAELSYWELPESWGYDWYDRVPDGITITDVPHDMQPEAE